MKKTVKIAFFSLLSLAIIAVAIWGSGIIFAMLKPAVPEIPPVTELVPAEKIPVGSDVKIRFELTVPENRNISSAIFDAPAGVTVVVPLTKKRKNGCGTGVCGNSPP